MPADAALLESPFAAACRRLCEAYQQAIDAWREMSRVTQIAYLQACAEDPGLHRAWEKWHRRNPDIGWLDVALARSEGRPA